MYYIVYNGNASILEMLSDTNQHNFFVFYKNNVIDGTILQPGGYEATECLIVFLILK